MSRLLQVLGSPRGAGCSTGVFCPFLICPWPCLAAVTLYGVFTNHYSANGPSRCLLLELLDVSVSELLLHSSNQGCSMWMIQHCARDVLEALAFLHHKGYVHADLKPRNILWSAEEECFKLIDFGLSFKEGNQVWNLLLSGRPALPCVARACDALSSRVEEQR